MARFIINGGKTLSGKVTVDGAKNSALKLLAASILADTKTTLTNVPIIEDVMTMVEVLKILGARVRVNKQKKIVEIDPSRIKCFEAPYELVRKMRASVLVLGPLVARLKKARVSLPGGCAIGARPINLHLKGLASLGADIDLKEGYVEASADKLKGADIYFDTVTVTGTENLMMAAVLAEGTTILRNAAREPEIVALAEVLDKMGADIQGAGAVCRAPCLRVLSHQDIVYIETSIASIADEGNPVPIPIGDDHI